MAGGVQAEVPAPTDVEAATRFDLRPHFVVGRASRYQVWESRVMNTHVAGPGGERSAELSMTTEGVMLWRVDTVAEDGSADCVIQIEHVTVTVVAPGSEPRVVDSREPGNENDRMRRWLSALVETPLRYRMNADGSVERFESLDAIRAAMDSHRSNVNPSMFIEQASTLATIPGAPADAVLGEAWERRVEWSRDFGGFPVLLDYQGKYALERITPIAGIDIATVRGDATLAGTSDTDRLPPNSPPLDMRIEAGHGTRRVMFDMVSREVVGRDNIEMVTLNVVMSIRGIAITTRIEERIHSQVLRTEEVDEQGEEAGP